MGDLEPNMTVRKTRQPSVSAGSVAAVCACHLPGGSSKSSALTVKIQKRRGLRMARLWKGHAQRLLLVNTRQGPESQLPLGHGCPPCSKNFQSVPAFLYTTLSPSLQRSSHFRCERFFSGMRFVWLTPTAQRCHLRTVSSKRLSF